jgi:hypothetical protein
VIDNKINFVVGKVISEFLLCMHNLKCIKCMRKLSTKWKGVQSDKKNSKHLFLITIANLIINCSNNTDTLVNSDSVKCLNCGNDNFPESLDGPNQLMTLNICSYSPI